MNQLEKLEDHDLLIMCVTQLSGIDRNLNNHLAHHQKREMVYLTVALGSILTAVISMVCLTVTFLAGRG